MDEPYEIEIRGAAEGINPLFGEWWQEFNLEPVSYSNAGAARADFRTSFRQQLVNKFVFVGQVWITITLYLNEQKMLETPAYGDLDNYAKQLLDCLKGEEGLIIDDCQVQRLDISWIDVPDASRFEVEIKSSPDDFLPIPLKLYEMPDGLFYPLSDKAWTTEGLVDVTEDAILALARALAEMTRAKRSLRHELRQDGVPQFRAFQYGKYVSPILLGFHRTRIAESGFALVPYREWSA